MKPKNNRILKWSLGPRDAMNYATCGSGRKFKMLHVLDGNESQDFRELALPPSCR